MSLRPSIISLRTLIDHRGALGVIESGGGLPFAPARLFLVWGVPLGDTRGQHAHRICEQLLICINGTVEVILDDGRTRQNVTLDAPDKALHIPAGVWGEQRYLTDDARLIVLASHIYDPADYIPDYADFLSYRGTSS